MVFLPTFAHFFSKRFIFIHVTTVVHYVNSTCALLCCGMLCCLKLFCDPLYHALLRCVLRWGSHKDVQLPFPDFLDHSVSERAEVFGRPAAAAFVYFLSMGLADSGYPQATFKPLWYLGFWWTTRSPHQPDWVKLIITHSRGNCISKHMFATIVHGLYVVGWVRRLW